MFFDLGEIDNGQLMMEEINLDDENTVVTFLK